MAYEREFIKMTFGGSLASGNDIWSCGLSIAEYTTFSFNFPGFFDVVVDRIDDLGTVVEAFIAKVSTNVPTNATLDWLKLAPIGTDGKYLGPAAEIELDGNGGKSGAYVPQAAMVVTLDSNKWKDPGKYNRFYLPFGSNTGGDWSLEPGEQVNMLLNCVDFIDELNGVLLNTGVDTNGRISVASATGDGTIMSVQRVRLGRIIDTQRRRRNSLPEQYISDSVTPLP